MPENGKPQFAADYVTVAERVAAFYEKFPEGSLQSRIIELSEARVVIEASAYRTADDARPGIGYSSLEIPGRTPYTRGSEIENCETSAWGRAIAALGFEVKRGIATQDEVENKNDHNAAPTRPTVVRQPVQNGPSEPDDPFGDLSTLDDAPTDTLTCAIHRVPWKGEAGDLYHKKEDGGYCRHPNNVKKPVAARR